MEKHETVQSKDSYSNIEPKMEISGTTVADKTEKGEPEVCNGLSANENTKLSNDSSANEKAKLADVDLETAAECAISVERLYELCEILDSANLSTLTEGAHEFEANFKELLAGVKGAKKQKQLACQFIMRFFKHFHENCLELTLDALFDLCEDMDASIRRQAIKELPNVCKEVPSTVARISDILAQLLQAEDTIEYAVVQSSLLQLVKIDAKQCLLALFTQILTATHTGGEIIRERSIKFLATKLPSLSPQILTPEIESLLIEKIQETMYDVTCQEFNTFIKILSSLRQMQQVGGRTRLVQVIMNQAGISEDEDKVQEFDPNDAEQVAVLAQCTKQALDFFSKNIPSTVFTVYFCTSVLPRVWELPVKCGDSAISGAPGGAVSQIDILKLLAELSITSGSLELSCVEHVFNALTRLLPECPKKDESSSSESKRSSPPELPNLMLSHLECLLFTFHTLAKQQGHLFLDQFKDRLKSARPTMLYLSSGIHHHINKLRSDISDCSQEELKEKENSVKVTALKVTLNITLLIKDLTRSPPSFDTVVTLSWKRVLPNASNKVTKRKHHANSNQSNDDHQGAGSSSGHRGPSSDGRGRQMYNPPSGKYSKQVHSYESQYRPGFKGSKHKLGVYFA